MKNILLIALLVTGVSYADDCNDYKRKASKYEKMGIEASDLDIGVKYLDMAIKNRKKTLGACFYSGGDKEKIRRDIKDIEEMKTDLRREASRERKHDLDVANKSSDRININSNNYYR